MLFRSLESLLDRVRNNGMSYAPAMTDVLLEAGDVIALQLAGHRHGAEVPAEAVEQVCRKLQQLLGEGTPPADPSAAVPELLPVGEEAGRRRLRIDFAPDGDIFQRGVRIEGLVAELKELGDLHASASVSLPEDMGDFHPERCYTSWRFTLATSASDDDIRDIFIFAAEEEQLSIVELPLVGRAKTAPGQAPEAATPDHAIHGRRACDRDETAPGAFGRRSGESESSIRVSVAKADQLINQVGELVITQAMLSQVAGQLDPVLYETLHRSLLQLERNTRDLQRSVMSIRLVPISLVFNRFPRMVRELAAKLGKQVELRLVGEIGRASCRERV